MPPKLKFLDHVALRVRDIEVSAAWYTRVLGLKRCHIKDWEPYPVFLLSGECGVALFPAPDGEDVNPGKKYVRIDHFAFNVNNEDFKEAKAHYEDLGLEHHIQDHKYFHSLYTKDPDGHTVELTTLVVSPEEFRKVAQI